MSRSNELEGGGGDSGASRTSFDLGSASEWVDGRLVDWRALVSYLVTVGVLIIAETGGRLVSGVFAFPRMGIDAAGSAAQRVTSVIVGNWPAVFDASFDAAVASMPDLGVAAFASGILFVLVWFLVLNELLEVL